MCIALIQPRWLTGRETPSYLLTYHTRIERFQNMFIMIIILVCAERNLNPKAACLKRREEEKTEELPGRALNSEDMASQAHLGSKVSDPCRAGWLPGGGECAQNSNSLLKFGGGKGWVSGAAIFQALKVWTNGENWAEVVFEGL